MKILTGGQFRELDSYTIEHEPIASIDLMERASRAIASELQNRWDSTTRFVVFAGPGGNGGDGLAVARLLAEAGYEVTAYLFNVNRRLNPDCQTNRDRLRLTQGAQLFEITEEFIFPTLRSDEVVVDALFGTGLNKPISGGFAHIVKRINQSACTIVSIDMPSGLMTEDNAFNDVSSVVRADVTLTLQLPKLAFLFAENHKYVGEVKVLDIGLSQQGLQQQRNYLWLTEEGDVRSMLRTRSPFAHKGDMGHALLVAGSRGMAGAAIMAAEAALRSGIGKLTIHSPLSNIDLLQAQVPQAIVEMDPDEDVVSSAIDADMYQAVGIGPGLGVSRHTAAAVHSYLQQQLGPMVIDADALNILSANPSWLDELPADSILTPHPKELDRLLGFHTNSFDRMNKARNLAITLHVFVVVKGRFTQVCTPTGDVYFNPTGNSGMATAGSGDVLTGILTGLLAQGYLPSEAAVLGVWLHGAAGDAAAAALGPECMLATDIIKHLPDAFRRLRASSSNTTINL